jgi:hypothetical protein
MESTAIQEMVRKIFSNEESKSQFIADPKSIISQYELTETETNAVMATHAKLGLATGNSTQLSGVVGPLTYWF